MIKNIFNGPLKRLGFKNSMITKVNILGVEIETGIEDDYDDGLQYIHFGYDKSVLSAEKIAAIEAEIEKMYPTKILPQTHELCR